jgi:hypothetical protein
MTPPFAQLITLNFQTPFAFDVPIVHAGRDCDFESTLFERASASQKLVISKTFADVFVKLLSGVLNSNLFE